MEKITTVGLDLAKQVMAVHGVGAEGRMVVRKVLRRDQLLGWAASLSPCVIAMEACGGAHHWARELTRQGHTVRIIAAEYVQPFRLDGKNDANCGGDLHGGAAAAHAFRGDEVSGTTGGAVRASPAARLGGGAHAADPRRQERLAGCPAQGAGTADERTDVERTGGFPAWPSPAMTATRSELDLQSVLRY